MKFSRAALLAAVDSAIDAHRAAHDEVVRRWEEMLEAHAAAWVDQHAAEWLEATQRVASLLRNGRPVTSADLPGEPGRVATYSEPWRAFGGQEKPGKYLGAPALESLRTILRAITDDEVNVTSLRQLGVTAATMRAAVDHLGRINSAAAS